MALRGPPVGKGLLAHKSPMLRSTEIGSPEVVWRSHDPFHMPPPETSPIALNEYNIRTYPKHPTPLHTPREYKSQRGYR